MSNNARREGLSIFSKLSRYFKKDVKDIIWPDTMPESAELRREEIYHQRTLSDLEESVGALRKKLEERDRRRRRWRDEICRTNARGRK